MFKSCESVCYGLLLVFLSSFWHTVAIVADDIGQFESDTYILLVAGLAPEALVSADLEIKEPVNSTFINVATLEQWFLWQSAGKISLPREGDEKAVRSSYFSTFWRSALHGNVTLEFKINSTKKDRYVFFATNPLSPQPVFLSGTLNAVNPGDQQLPLEYVGLTGTLFWLSALFIASSAIVCALLRCRWRRKANALDWVMLMVLLLKSIVHLLHGCDIVMLSGDGKHFPATYYGWKLLDKLQEVMELMMLLLMSYGWKFLRRWLTRSEIKFAVGVSVTSTYLGIFEVACTTNISCEAYELSRYILHSLCYLGIIVALNINLQMLQFQIHDTPVCQAAGHLYQKHRAYVHFRVLITVFVSRAAVDLWLWVALLPWPARWMWITFQEVRNYLIYVILIAEFNSSQPPLRVFELAVENGSGEYGWGDADG